MALMVGMYHTRELFNKELSYNEKDNSANDWFDNLYK
jgi:hypothetical protein